MNCLILGCEIAVYPAGTLVPQGLDPNDTIPTRRFRKMSGPPESPTQLSEPSDPAQSIRSVSFEPQYSLQASSAIMGTSTFKRSGLKLPVSCRKIDRIFTHKDYEYTVKYIILPSHPIPTLWSIPQLLVAYLV